MVKCSKSELRRLKTALRWKIPADPAFLCRLGNGLCEAGVITTTVQRMVVKNFLERVERHVAPRTGYRTPMP
jgi:hypothetical protein